MRRRYQAPTLPTLNAALGTTDYRKPVTSFDCLRRGRSFFARLRAASKRELRAIQHALAAHGIRYEDFGCPHAVEVRVTIPSQFLRMVNDPLRECGLR